MKFLTYKKHPPIVPNPSVSTLQLLEHYAKIAAVGGDQTDQDLRKFLSDLIQARLKAEPTLFFREGDEPKVLE